MTTETTCLLVLLAFLIILAFYVAKVLRRDGVVEEGAAMPRGKRRILTIYLLTVGCAFVFMLVSLTSLDFPQTPVIPLPTEIPSPAPAPAPSQAESPATATVTPPAPVAAPTPIVPVLLRIFPQVKGGTMTTPKLALYGRNFSDKPGDKSKVRFNMQPVASEYLAENLITVPMESEYLMGKGSIMVDVVNGTAISNAISVPIEKPQVRLNVFFCYTPWITREIQLLLLVIFAGALGSYLHAIRSITHNIARRDLIASWFWWYISRPFLGMAMGLVFYAVVRGGFLAGTPADANVVNPFGVLAIGALVGMFSDKAAEKLAEIFTVVFRSAEPPPDKEGNLPLIDKVEPAAIISGGAEPVKVKITGKRLGKVFRVSVNEVERVPDPVGETEIFITLQPEEIAGPGQIEIRAITQDRVISDPAIINVSEPTGAEETSPVIVGLTPASVVAGETAPVEVILTGARLSKVTIVRVNSDDRTPDAVSEAEISFKLKVEDVAEEGQISISAVSPDGASPEVVLQVVKSAE